MAFTIANLRATALVALSGILYGLLGFFGTQLINTHLSVVNMLFWRFLIASLWILIWQYCTKKSDLIKLSQDIPYIPWLLAGLCYSCASLFFFIASKSTGTGLAMVIFFSYPMFVVIFSWYKKSSNIGPHTLGALLIIIAGLFLLKEGDKTTVSSIGVMWGLAAALCYAIYIHSSKLTATRLTSSQSTLLVCTGCTVLFLIYVLATHSFTLPASIKAWGYACALGIIATALPIQLLLEGLKDISSLKASVISVLEPIVTLLVGIALLNESISFMQTVGILLLLLGAISIQFIRE